MDSIAGVGAPPVYVNLNMVVASVFTDKRYKEALSFLSLAITFVQSASSFTTGDSSRYTVELMASSLQ